MTQSCVSAGQVETSVLVAVLHAIRRAFMITAGNRPPGSCSNAPPGGPFANRPTGLAGHLCRGALWCAESVLRRSLRVSAPRGWTG